MSHLNSIAGIEEAITRAQRQGAHTRARIEEKLAFTSEAGQRDYEEGSTTVEYAIGAVAAAGFAGLLLVVLKSGAVKALLQGIITSALTL